MSGGEQPSVSIVIVSWNVVSALLDCLASLFVAPQRIPFAVTVVDNASHDGTAEAVRRAFPVVDVIANEQNVGFARACNQGIRQTQGDLVLLLNPDCRLLGGALATMAAYMVGRPEIAALGPRLVRADGADDLRNPRRLPTLWSDFCDRSGLADMFPRSRFVAAHHLPGWDRSSSGMVDGLSGACMLLRRSALAQIGLLDEDFFLFGEDADLCLRLRAAGWQLYYLGTAAVVHEGGASTRQVRTEAALQALAGRQRFFRKHRGALYAWLHRLLNCLLAAARLAALAPLAAVAPAQRARLRRQWQLLRWCVRPTETMTIR